MVESSVWGGSKSSFLVPASLSPPYSPPTPQTPNDIHTRRSSFQRPLQIGYVLGMMQRRKGKVWSFSKPSFQRACRIILEPPKHVLGAFHTYTWRKKHPISCQPNLGVSISPYSSASVCIWPDPLRQQPSSFALPPWPNCLGLNLPGTENNVVCVAKNII